MFWFVLGLTIIPATFWPPPTSRGCRRTTSCRSLDILHQKRLVRELCKKKLEEEVEKKVFVMWQKSLKLEKGSFSSTCLCATFTCADPQKCKKTVKSPEEKNLTDFSIFAFYTVHSSLMKLTRGDITSSLRRENCTSARSNQNFRSGDYRRLAIRRRRKGD